MLDLLLIAALASFCVALALIAGSFTAGLLPFSVGCVGLWYLLGDS